MEFEFESEQSASQDDEKFEFAGPPKFEFVSEQTDKKFTALDKASAAGANLLSGGLTGAEYGTVGTLEALSALQSNSAKEAALDMAADALRGTADKIFKPDPLPESATAAERMMYQDIPKATGQAGINLAISFLNRPLSLVTLFGQGFEGQRQDAEMSGADGATQELAGLSGGAVETLTETIGLEAIRAKLPLTGWKGKVAEVGFAAATNSLQETAAGMLNDLQAKYGLEYDPKRDVWQERGSDAIIGGAVGGILGTLTTLAGLRGGRVRTHQNDASQPGSESDAQEFFEEATGEADADSALTGELLTPEEIEQNLMQLERYGEIIDGEFTREPDAPIEPAAPGYYFESDGEAAGETSEMGVSDGGLGRVGTTLAIDADTRQPVADLPPLDTVTTPPLAPEQTTSSIPPTQHEITIPEPQQIAYVPETVDTSTEEERAANVAEVQVETETLSEVPPMVQGLSEGESRTYLRLMDKVDMGEASPAELERFTQLQEKSAGELVENLRRPQSQAEKEELERTAQEVRDIEGSAQRGTISGRQGLQARDMEATLVEMQDKLPQLPMIKIFGPDTPMADVAKRSADSGARAFFVPAQPNHPQPVMYLKDGAFTSVESLQRAVVHEGVVHHGLRALAYAKESNPFRVEEQVAAWMEPFYESFADEINARVVGELGYELDTKDPAQRARAAEEWLADMAERKNFDNKFKAAWNKFVTRVMRWLRTNTVTKDWAWVKKAKRSEVEAMLEELHRRAAQPQTKVTPQSVNSRLAKVKVVGKVEEMELVAKAHPLTKFPNKAVLTEVNSEALMPVESRMEGAKQVIYPKGNPNTVLAEVFYESEARQTVMLVRARDARTNPIVAAQIHRHALMEGRQQIDLGPALDIDFIRVMRDLYPGLPEVDAGRSPFIPPLMQKGKEERYEVVLKEYGLEEQNIALQQYRHDKVGFFLRNFGNLMQMVNENQHVPGVLEYWNVAQQIPAYVRKHARVAEDNIKRLRELSAKEQENMWNFMMQQEFYYDFSREKYGTSQWLVPHSGLPANTPVAPEKVVKRALEKFGMTEELLEVYDNIASSMHSIIVELEQLKLDELNRTLGNDMEKLNAAKSEVFARFADMKRRPYLPRIRFGKYVLRAYYTKDVKNGKGEVVHKKGDIYLASAFESKSERARIAKKIREEGYKTDESMRLSGADVNAGILNSDFLELLKDNLNLTKEQRGQMAELMEQYSPTIGFAKHLKQRKGVAGWSNDFRRAYATYMMTAGHALSKIKYKPELTRASNKITQSAYTLFDQYGQPIEKIAKLEQSTQTDSRELLSNWFKSHREYLLSFDNEMAVLNTLAYVNYLWAVPKAAFVNLSQTPLVTLPYLGSRYGYVNAEAELIKNLKYLQMWNTNSMKFGEAPQYMRDAIEAARRVGLFDETLMRQLGNAANGYEITKTIQNSGQVIDRGKEYFQQLMWIGGMPFNAAEKLNRMLAFTTAYTLEHKKRAKEKGVKPDEYLAPQLAAIQRVEDSLLNEPAQEKTAPFVAGRMAVQQTQFIFGKMNRPPVFRGSYLNWMGSMQTPFIGILYALGRDQAKFGILAVLLLLSGLEGFPFANWAFSAFDIAATKFIEKTADSTTELPVNSRLEVREFLRDKLENPIVNPMLLASGLLGPEGVLNIASSISMGDPMNVGKTVRDNALLNSDRTDPSLTQALITSFVVPDMIDSYYTGLMSNRSNSLIDKVASLTPGLRKPYQTAKWYEEGGVYTKGGLPLVEFGEQPDATNPYTLEWMSAFLGFNPATISQSYERYQEASDAARYWSARREDLRARAKNARTEDSQKVVDEAIRKYNSQLPKGGKGKLYLPSSRVIQAQMAKEVVKSQNELGIPSWSRDKYSGD